MPATPCSADIGKCTTQVEIRITTTTKGKVETFLAFELFDCGFSSYSTSGDGPPESLSLTSRKVIVVPTPLDKSGQTKKGAVVSYDRQMKAS